MKFQTLLVWWLILPIALLGLGAIGWQIWKIRPEGKKTLLKWVRRACLMLLLVIISLGPSIPGGRASPGIANLDVLFAVDTTASMGAEDYAGNKLRIDGAKQDLLALGAKLQGAHLALITFDSKVNTVLPFTVDNATFVASVESLHQETQGTSKGSAIDKPIQMITQELKKRKSEHPERSRLLFYLGDGEQTTDKSPESFDPIAQYVDGGGILGYGTAGGAKMVKYTTATSDTSKPPSYVNALDPQTKSFSTAISKYDEAALRRISEQLKISFYNRNSGGLIDEVYQSSRAELLTDKERAITYYINLYWLFAIPFTILLLWEWKEVLRLVLELRKEQRSKHA